jgi:hypothetical protein
MNETMTRYGRKPTGTEKINKLLLIWVEPSRYASQLEESQAAGFQSLGPYVRECKLTPREAEREI